MTQYRKTVKLPSMTSVGVRATLPIHPVVDNEKCHHLVINIDENGYEWITSIIMSLSVSDERRIRHGPSSSRSPFLLLNTDGV